THLAVRHDKPLRQFDPLISDTLVELMAEDGPTLLAHHQVKSVSKNSDGSLKVDFDNGQCLEVDSLIWAIGRSPANDQLGLDDIGVELDEKGYIKVDKFQNTTVAGIYAV